MISYVFVIEIAEELELACAPLRAVACLENCARVTKDGTARPVFVPGVKAYFKLHIERPTTFRLASQDADRTVVASARIRWESEAGGLLPSFDGSLNVYAHGTGGVRSLLVIRGNFTATPGRSGKQLDDVFSGEIARETAGRVLERMRKACESFTPAPNVAEAG